MYSVISSPSSFYKINLSNIISAHRVKGHSSLKEGGNLEVWDIEDLVALGNPNNPETQLPLYTK